MRFLAAAVVAVRIDIDEAQITTRAREVQSPLAPEMLAQGLLRELLGIENVAEALEIPQHHLLAVGVHRGRIVLLTPIEIVGDA